MVRAAAGAQGSQRAASGSFARLKPEAAFAPSRGNAPRSASHRVVEHTRPDEQRVTVGCLSTRDPGRPAGVSFVSVRASRYSEVAHAAQIDFFRCPQLRIRRGDGGSARGRTPRQHEPGCAAVPAQGTTILKTKGAPRTDAPTSTIARNEILLSQDGHGWLRFRNMPY
jgi:hypothetical protein